MKKLLKYFLPLLSVVAAGCSSDEVAPDTGNPREPRPDEVTLCLDVSINGGGTSTRAADDPDYYQPASGDFEKIESLRVLIVRNIRKDGEGKETGIIEGNRLVATDDAGNPRFDNLEFKVQANEEKRIYLIANEKYLTSPVTGRSVSAFLDTYLVRETRDLDILADWTVSLPGLTDATTAVTTTGMGMFFPKEGARLPLSEFFNVTVGSKEQSIDDRWFAHLFMTRCSAKARFFLKTGSNFSGNDEAGNKIGNLVNSRITAITLEGVGTTEYVFPRETEYSPSKADLITSGSDVSKDISEAYIKTFATPETNRTVIYTIDDLSEEIRQSTDNSGETISKPITETIYFPESILGDGKQYTVGVQLDGLNWLYAPLETNILKVEGKDAIARSTYLPIVLQFDAAMNLSVTVLPWNREEMEVDFSDHVGMSDDGALTFTENTYAEGGLDKANGRLVLRDYPLATSGTFTIGSPVGQRWDAYLITVEGEQNAIQFVVKDESGKDSFTDHISGIVGTPANFKVAATSSASNQQREAVMQVMVTLEYGGISVPVNVLEGNSEYKTDRITFIQNSK